MIMKKKIILSNLASRYNIDNDITRILANLLLPQNLLPILPELRQILGDFAFLTVL
jgi:hypothetical protein